MLKSLKILQLLVLPICILLFWNAASKTGDISNYLLPTIERVVESFYQLVQSQVLIKHISASLQTIAKGFVISATLAITLSVLFYSFPIIGNLFKVPLTLLRIIPPLAMLPLLMLWFGIGAKIQFVIVVLASFFPIFLNTNAGLNTLDKDTKELVQILQLPKLHFLIFVLLAHAVPHIVVGLRLGFSYAFRSLVAAELIAASSGLGFMISDAQELQQTDIVICGIFTIGFLGFLLDYIFIKTTKTLLSKRFSEI